MTPESFGGKTIRIATRTSPLAMWQANAVKDKLEGKGYLCEIVGIESTGDLNLRQPIYTMGISGVFTKQLDSALINNQADIAVHSLKDVPTNLAEGLALGAVLERGAWEDVALIKNKAILADRNSAATIATSSLRRRAQWLAKYPKHQMVPIRGNVQTRLKKFWDNPNIDGVIFAKAGLERMDLLPADAVTLNWMLPAPAQGIIGVVCRENNSSIIEACSTINNLDAFYCALAERQFLNTLMGGCSVPLSALANIDNGLISLCGAIHDFDGQAHFTVLHSTSFSNAVDCGREAANKLLQQDGAKELMESIRNKIWDEEDTIN